MALWQTNLARLWGRSAMWGLLLAGFLAIHGLIYVGIGLAVEHSWLLSDILGDAVSPLAKVVYGVATVGFVAAGVGVLGLPAVQDWWRVLAVVSAVTAIAGFVIFFNGVMGAWSIFVQGAVGAILDVGILIGLYSIWQSGTSVSL